MTRAEAIEVLESDEWWFTLDDRYTVSSEENRLRKAVDMAIAALQEGKYEDSEKG